MPQGTLSSANVVQAKTGNITGTTASVSLDVGTQAGSTVIIEIDASGIPFTDGGDAAAVPDGFEMDAKVDIFGAPYLFVFRKRNVAAGEGVAGSTSWDFVFANPNVWNWRVTEWDQALEPVFPLERVATNSASGTGVTTLSTGTTIATSRPNVVALAWHSWHRATVASAQTFDWSDHTNGFVERDEYRLRSGALEAANCWSWAFGSSAQTWECTATVNTTPRDVSDFYMGMIVVYAATTYG